MIAIILPVIWMVAFPIGIVLSHVRKALIVSAGRRIDLSGTFGQTLSGTKSSGEENYRGGSPF